MANSRALRSFGFEVLLHSNAQTDRDFPEDRKKIFGANNRLHFKIMEAARSKFRSLWLALDARIYVM